jgi:hypothetical protein
VARQQDSDEVSLESVNWELEDDASCCEPAVSR